MCAQGWYRGCMEGMNQMPQRQKQADAPERALRLGDMGDAMLVQNALMLLLYELRHDAVRGLIVPDGGRGSNSDEIRYAASREWLNEEAFPKGTPFPPDAFGAYTKKNSTQMVNIHDRDQLMSILNTMGVDMNPPTLH